MDDDELVMISALEHYSYCPRQCALIHLDQSWDENSYTMRGAYRHERVDQEENENRPGIRREWAIPLWSTRLGLVGRADLVEFLPGGPYPVEYKSSRKRRWVHETIQLGAQALCLEEMTDGAVPFGAIYYDGSRSRREVEIDAELRTLVKRTTMEVRCMLSGSELPEPVHDARCRHCSLIEACMPEVSRNQRRERAAIARLFTVD